MKTPATSSINSSDVGWVQACKLYKHLRCARNTLRNWRLSGRIKYRQPSPHSILVYAPEVVEKYTERYPNIEIDHAAIEDLIQSSA
jgi:hypothetical protein